MKKLVVGLLCAAMIVGTLTGCGSSNADNAKVASLENKVKELEAENQKLKGEAVDNTSEENEETESETGDSKILKFKTFTLELKECKTVHVDEELGQDRANDFLVFVYNITNNSGESKMPMNLYIATYYQNGIEIDSGTYTIGEYVSDGSIPQYDDMTNIQNGYSLEYYVAIAKPKTNDDITIEITEFNNVFDQTTKTIVTPISSGI